MCRGTYATISRLFDLAIFSHFIDLRLVMNLTDPPILIDLDCLHYEWCFNRLIMLGSSNQSS